MDRLEQKYGIHLPKTTIAEIENLKNLNKKRINAWYSDKFKSKEPTTEQLESLQELKQ